MINFLITAINYLSCIHQDLLTDKALSCTTNSWKLFVGVGAFIFIANFILSCTDADFPEAFGTSVILAIVAVILFTLFMLIFGSYLLYGILGFIGLYGIHALIADENNNGLKRAVKNWQRNHQKKKKYKKQYQEQQKLIQIKIEDTYLKAAEQEVEKILKYE